VQECGSAEWKQLRDDGNEKFDHGDYAQAGALYWLLEYSVNLCTITDNTAHLPARTYTRTPAHPPGEKYSDALMFISLTDRPARIHLLNNRALSHLKAGKFNQAIYDAESVLHLAIPAAGSSGSTKNKEAVIKVCLFAFQIIAVQFCAPSILYVDLKYQRRCTSRAWPTREKETPKPHAQICGRCAN